uniref:Uncharacterized protein n=1 Tax=Rhizophora mucronata TaxID=61149 RepID=A0A2P2NZ36_RHIMU
MTSKSKYAALRNVNSLQFV